MTLTEGSVRLSATLKTFLDRKNKLNHIQTRFLSVTRVNSCNLAQNHELDPDSAGRVIHVILHGAMENWKYTTY